MTHTKNDKAAAHEGSVKETLIAILISLTIALAARSYATEAFIIPTGSMAPTLYGAHLNYHFDENGAEWASDVWYRGSDPNKTPIAVQTVADSAGRITEAPSATVMYAAPMSEAARDTSIPMPAEINAEVPRIPPISYRTSAGDRILVHKYLYHLREPKRFDVVVFKSPEEIAQNYIKRLLGLPSETVWLAGGDVFSTTDVPARLSNGRTVPPPDSRWSIRRKPERIQKSLWRPVYSSEYAPLDNKHNGRKWFDCPWSGDDWQTYDAANDRDLTVYRADTADPTMLSWNADTWPITDYTPYNDQDSNRTRVGVYSPRLGSFEQFVLPVSDVRIRAGVEPDQAGLSVSATIHARSHEFRAVIEDGAARILMHHENAENWSEMASAPVTPFAAHKVTDIEFWHADQSLSIYINSKRVAYAEYNWGPSERLLHATGHAGIDYAEGGPAAQLQLDQTFVYTQDFPRIEWNFAGSALSLHRVGVDHDVYYRADTDPFDDDPGFGTHPDNLAIIGPDQFFTCGDNSAASHDARLWGSVNPQVLKQFKDTRGPEWENSEDKLRGVVPRQLMLGKAYCVYFPAPFSFSGRIPIPNVARMRAIR